MLYLLDANILITANSLYYPIEQVPEVLGLDSASGQFGQRQDPARNLGRNKGWAQREQSAHRLDFD